MGKFVGLAGALTTVGAVAYLMAPLPQSASDLPARAAAARSGVPDTRTAVASKPTATPEPSIRTVSPGPTPRGEPTVALVQQIQAELHRVGCYVGAIDGRWTDASQRAMQTLGERVSVLRPVDTPDYIMLALARSQTGTVCGQATQRSAAAQPRGKWAAIAAPEIAGPGRGEVRPTNGTSRVAAAEPDRPSASEQPKVWRALPDAAAKRTTARDASPNDDAIRLKAARDELMRIETRKRAATAASAVQPSPVATPVDAPAPESRPLPDTTRMGLGVAPGDPLLAHIDPRDPNAPAILRGLPQPLPRVASHSVDRPAGIETAPPSATLPTPAPARTAAPRPAKPELSASEAKKRAKREWMRNVFTNMRYNGP
jgi:hypothetical protein